MDSLFSPPVPPVTNSFSSKKQLSAELEKPTDTKIRGFVLEKMGQVRVGSRGALLPSMTAPRAVINLLSAFAISPVVEGKVAPSMEWMPLPRRKRQQRLRKALRSMIPVGLRRCRPYEWINAWIQFFLFLPQVAELFSFMPRSFDSFREFSEQYALDQLENRAVSSANSAALIRCLFRMLPDHCFQNPFQIDPYELLCSFTQAAFPRSLFNSVLFHPEWHLILDEKENAFYKRIEHSPPELLIAVRRKEVCSFLKKQIGNGCWYDLDAFIECRPDGQSLPSYIAYVKVEGTWYQCDDDRITPLLSTTLNIPLHGGTLFHYKKVPF